MGLVVNPEEAGFAGTILLSSEHLRSRSIAYFNASATENRISTLPGYVGAAIFSSSTEDKVFELVLWRTPGALAAVRGDPRFYDHVKVLDPYVQHPLLCFSPVLLTGGSVTFRRGDAAIVTASVVRNAAPELVASQLKARGTPKAGDVIHVGTRDGDALVVSISGGPAPSELPIPGEVLWEFDFEVIEAFHHSQARAGAPVPYRLLPAVEALHHG